MGADVHAEGSSELGRLSPLSRTAGGDLEGPIRGRTAERRLLHSSLRALEQGRGGAVLIEGPAGIGKTRLVQEAIRIARDNGVRIAIGRAEHDGWLLPLRPLAAALAALSTSTAMTGDDVAAQRRKLLKLLAERTRARPLLVVLEDLHWADSATLEVVASLTCQTPRAAMLWLLTARDGHKPRLLLDLASRLGKAPHAAVLQLGPLPFRAAAAVTQDLLGGKPAAPLLRLVREVGSTPLHLVELLEDLLLDGIVEVADGHARLVSARSARQRAKAILGCRLQRLSAQTMDHLKVLATLGESFTVEDVAEVVDQPVGRLPSLLEEAISAGILLPTGRTLRFRHDAIRAAILEETPEPIRQALQRHVCRFLLKRGDPAARVAAHLLLSAEANDPDLLVCLDQAVLEVLPWSPSTAADLARHGVERTGPDDDRLLARTLTAVHTSIAAGRLDDAVALARAQLSSDAPPSVPRAALELALSRILIVIGDADEAITRARAIHAAAGLPESIRTAAEVTHLVAMTGIDLHAAREPAEATLAGQHPSGADSSLSAALHILGLILWERGQIADALGHLRAAVHRADQSPGGPNCNYPHIALAELLAAVGHADDARAVVRRLEKQMTQADDTLWAPALPITAARVAAAAGRTGEAATLATEGLALAEGVGAQLFLPPALSVLTSVALARGALGQADRYVQRLQEVAHQGPRDAYVGCLVTWAAARLAEARSGPPAALKLLKGLHDHLSDCKRLLLEQPAAAWLVRVALAAGAQHRAEMIVRCAQQLADDNREFPTVGAAAAHARGLLARDANALALAAAEYAHPWARGSAAEDAGVVHGEANREAALASYETALRAYQLAGADRDARRVRARMRKLAKTKGRSATHARRPQWGWSSLTDTEWRVIHLVAEGLTNRQVAARMHLSHHTVDYHLRHIFRKLRIGSRVQLVRLVLERGAAQQEPARPKAHAGAGP